MKSSQDTEFKSMLAIWRFNSPANVEVKRSFPLTHPCNSSCQKLVLSTANVCMRSSNEIENGLMMFTNWTNILRVVIKSCLSYRDFCNYTWA